MNTFHIYRHRRLDTNEIFYVGIGSGYRASNKSSRNKYWKNITNKVNYAVEILYDNIDRETAIELEIFLIELYGRKDLKKGLLVNRTDGGDGNFGLFVSEETRSKQRKARLGKKLLPETIEKKKKYNKGNCKLARRVICIETNNIWNCIQDAADCNGIKYGTLKSYLCGSLTNKTSLRYYEQH